VITKTIVLNPLQQMNPRPCMARIQSGLLNTERCSEIKLEDWCRKEFRVAKEAAVPVIASVGITPEEVRVIAPAAEEAGADMLELSVFIPYDDPKPLLDAIRAAKEWSSLPISVKLNANVADVAELALAAKEEGADAFSAIDGLNAGMAVDIEAGRPVLGEQGYGRISGAAIKPLALRCVAEVAHHTGLPVMGTGGGQRRRRRPRDADGWGDRGWCLHRFASPGPRCLQEDHAGNQRVSSEKGLLQCHRSDRRRPFAHTFP